MRRRSAQTREHVLEVAHDLFYGRGIRATGVDQVAAAAEVAPTTLYRLFGSKDGLVGAYVERADRQTRSWVDAAVGAAGEDPRARLLAIFDTLTELLRPPSYRGCACLMALAEYPDKDSPPHEHAVVAKRWVRDRFAALVDDLAKTASVVQPAVLADELALVFEGAQAAAQALGADGPARLARPLAENLIDVSIRPDAPPRRKRPTRS
jgi:AcrR family transcriptional regulator